MRMRRITAAALAAWLLSIAAGQLYAQQDVGKKKRQPRGLLELRIGNLRIEPSLKTSHEYDSNIFLTKHNRQHDFITRVSPGLTLRLDTEHIRARFRGRTVYKDFAKHSQYDAWEHFLDGRVELVWKPVTVGASGSAGMTVLPFDSEFTDYGFTDLVFPQRIEVLRSRISPYVRFQQDPWEVEARFARYSFDVDEHEFSDLDYRKHQGSLRIAHSLSERLFLVAQVVGGHMDYQLKLKDDYNSIESTLGIGGRVFDSLDFLAQAGMHLRNHDRGSGRRLFTRNYHSWAARARVRYRPSDEDELLLSYARRPEESTQTRFVRVDRAEARYTRRFTEEFQLSAAGSWELRRESEGWFMVNEIDRRVVEVDQRTKRRYSVGLNARFEPEPWLSLELSHTFRAKRTNDGTGEYNDHRTMFAATLRF